MATVFEARTTAEAREPGAQGVGAATQATGAAVETTKRAAEAATASLAAAGATNGHRGYAAGMPGIQGRGLEALANLAGIQLRNLDAFAAAQKAALQSIGTLAKQQQETMTASFRAAAALPALLFEGDARDRVAKPIDAVKAAMLDSTANSNVMSELAARSSATVATILQDRTLAALDELKATLLQALPPAPKA